MKYHFISFLCRDLSSCVFWHGDLSKEDNSPVISIVKPGDEIPSDVAVTRILVFLYAGK
jgi:hypothetical protein